MPRKVMLLFIGLFVLCSICVYVVPANAQGETRWERYELVTTWGSRGTENGQFINPSDIAVDSSGNVYVADTDNHRIQKFNSDGAFITKWGSFGTRGAGQFSYPSGVAVDSSGNVWVSSISDYAVQKFNSNGGFISKVLNEWDYVMDVGSVGSPGGLDFDSFGNVYVTNLLFNSVKKFNSDGTYITAWGGRGSEDGQFISPYGIAVDSSGNVYVADSGNHRIQKFDSNGRFITKWGSQGTGDGQFNSPDGIAVDSSGSVYVSDSFNYRIQHFDSNGRFLGKWGSRGLGINQFGFCKGIAVDSSRNIYVVDSGNSRIQKFRRTEAGGEVVVTTTTTIGLRAVMATAALPPQYIISVHEGGGKEGIVRTVHADNLENLIYRMSAAVVAAPGAVVGAPATALGAPIENAEVRVGGETLTTDSNGRTRAFMASAGDRVTISKRGYKALIITIPPKKYTDRFTGIVIQLKRQLGTMTPVPPIRTPVGP